MDINCDVINYELDKWKTINDYIRFVVLEEINIEIVIFRNMKVEPVVFEFRVKKFVSLGCR